ncbi:MAG: Gmad2 immunoglobulin-like domain-containing protein, partial [Patescibacteria group bacterium]
LFYLSRNLGFLPMTNFNFQFIWPVLFILAGLLLTNRHSRISIIVGVFSALVFMLIVTFIVNYGQVRDEYGTEAVMPALRHVERAKTVSSITEVKLDNFKVGEIVSSPLSIEGSALGTWFFEGSFPVKVLDQSGQELGRGVAQAQESWMTTGFVPFKASIVFTKPTSSTGSLVLQKDNPSGLSQNDKQVVFPINF